MPTHSCPPRIDVLELRSDDAAVLPIRGKATIMRDSSCWLCLGSILAGLAVVTGAFAAHGLDGFLVRNYADGASKKVVGVEVPLAVKRLQDFRTAAEYQMYHALALIAVGLLLRSGPSTAGQVAGWSFLLGILLFSGSLYVLVLSGKTWWGMVTPIGGLLFIIGWAALAISSCMARSQP
jgi:uncharacterized membrane protein YgdD (TMEM256/DUF423 family)